MKIFISSTYLDLKIFRDSVDSYLNQFSVIIKKMEKWGSKENNPLDVCLSNLRESDLYLGIYGQRYGSIDPTSGLSITELEYIEAKKLKIPRLIFIMSDEYRIESKWVDKGECAVKLATFKDSIIQNPEEAPTVTYFDTFEKFNEMLALSFESFCDENSIDIGSLNFAEIWTEISKSLAENVYPEELQLDLENISDQKSVIDELSKSINGLNRFHEHVSTEFYELQKIVYGELDKHEIQDIIERYWKYNWEWITLFPNRITVLKKILYSLKLHFLYFKLKTEPWSKSITDEIVKTKAEFKDHAVKSGYID